MEWAALVCSIASVIADAFSSSVSREHADVACSLRGSAVVLIAIAASPDVHAGTESRFRRISHLQRPLLLFLVILVAFLGEHTGGTHTRAADGLFALLALLAAGILFASGGIDEASKKEKKEEGGEGDTDATKNGNTRSLALSISVYGNSRLLRAGLFGPQEVLVNGGSTDVLTCMLVSFGGTLGLLASIYGLFRRDSRLVIVNGLTQAIVSLFLVADDATPSPCGLALSALTLLFVEDVRRRHRPKNEEDAAAAGISSFFDVSVATVLVMGTALGVVTAVGTRMSVVGATIGLVFSFLPRLQWLGTLLFTISFLSEIMDEFSFVPFLQLAFFTLHLAVCATTIRDLLLCPITHLLASISVIVFVFCSLTRATFFDIAPLYAVLPLFVMRHEANRTNRGNGRGALIWWISGGIVAVAAAASSVSVSSLGTTATSEDIVAMAATLVVWWGIGRSA